jgi:DNA-binding Lrp family transcriptional regulator
MEKQYIVRDLRKKEQFIVDDAYLNGYAKLVSPFATLAYLSLCRHADKGQQAFPSYEIIAEEFNISKPSAIKGIRELEEWKIITIEKSKNLRSGKQNPNIYVLLNKSEWKDKPTRVNDIDPDRVNVVNEPSKRQEENRVNDIDCKETHIKETHIKDSDAGIAKEDVDKFIDLFKDISPMNYKDWFGRPPQRKAAAELLKVASLEKYENLVKEVLPKLNLIPYISKDCKAFSPWELQKNFDKIRAKWLELGNKEKEHKSKYKPIKIIEV